MHKIASLEIEKQVLACLFTYPDSYAEFENFKITESCFTQQNKIIFNVIESLLRSGSAVNDVLVISKLNALGIKSDTIDYPTYVEALALIPVSKHATKSLLKELKLISVKRDIIKNCQETIDKITKENFTNLGEIVKVADSTFNKYTNIFNENSGVISITENLEEKIEERGNNPVEFIGLRGPFENVNRIYGSLSRDAAITMVAARTGIGKTKLGMFYNIFLARQYNLPILHLDFGEMTYEELLWRTAACLVNDEVPMYYIETGQWRYVPEYVDKIRKIGIPLAKKLKIDYQDVSDMSPMDIISVIRRYSYGRVGRDNKFLVNYDYLKPFDPTDSGEDIKEHILMGRFLKEMKSFLKNEMPVPFWCSIQQNRSGTLSAKGPDDTTNSISISDRICQQTNHTFILRYKTPQEISEDGPEFGNSKIIFVKTRSRGKDGHLADYVKSDDGRFMPNFINMQINGFTFEDRGDYSNVLVARARKQASMQENPPQDSGLL